MNELFEKQSEDVTDICKSYHEWYYNNKLWETTTFMGIHTLKSVSDMWNYQEIIFSLQPSLIIEFGSYNGGATLFFSMLLDHIDPSARILTVDINGAILDPRIRIAANVEVLNCSSTDPKVAERIELLRKEHKGPVFAILDSDHVKKHVLDEMILLRNLLKKGDYLIVEDSNINGHPVLPDYGEGPYEAITDYFMKYPDDYSRDVKRENKFGFTFAPHGYLIRRMQRRLELIWKNTIRNV